MFCAMLRSAVQLRGAGAGGYAPHTPSGKSWDCNMGFGGSTVAKVAGKTVALTDAPSCFYLSSSPSSFHPCRPHIHHPHPRPHIHRPHPHHHHQHHHLIIIIIIIINIIIFFFILFPFHLYHLHPHPHLVLILIITIITTIMIHHQLSPTVFVFSWSVHPGLACCCWNSGSSLRHYSRFVPKMIFGGHVTWCEMSPSKKHCPVQ